ncbi:MAG: hypothetical protein ACOX3W_06850 [Christensenellaceae bacterium]|jgi:hypothetical protein
MKLRKMLEENGILETFNNMGFDAEEIIAGLTEETDAQYMKYEWVNGGRIVHAIPPRDMLEEGYPWEEWYNAPQQPFQHHILYIEKTDKCDMTFDCPPTDETHPEATRNQFWYLYNDEDSSLLYAR